MRMSKKKEIVPKFRFPEFQRDGIDFVHGNKLFKSITNKNHNSDLPILAITQDQGAVPRDQIEYNVTVTDKSLSNYKVVEVGDFIISLRSFQGGIEYSRFKGICSPAYIILRKREENISELYYKYFFKTWRYIQSLNRNLEGIRDGKMISYSQFSSVKVPYPRSFKEQQKIADCLSSIDELIDAENRKLKALEKYKKGLMQKLFPAEGKTLPEWRFPEFQGCGEWNIDKLGNLCKITTGKLDANAMVANGKYRFYTCAKEFFQIDKYAFNTEALLISGNGANVGYIHYYKGKFNAYQRTYVLDQFYEDIHYIQYYLERNLSRRINTEKNEGNTPYIVLKTLTDMDIFFPKDLKEQQKIADCLSKVDTMIEEQSNKVEQLKAHKKGLMQGLFPSFEEADV